MGRGVSIRALEYRYPGGFSVSVPCLELRPGVPAALTGISGSGKSTVVECIGLLKHGSCTRFILGDSDVLAVESEAQRAHLRQGQIGFMPQSGGLVAFLTVRENLQVQIMLALKARGIAQNKAPALLQQAKEVAAALGIADVLNKYPHQLSVGQRQRAVFCRAVSAQPQLLLIDEPTAALDPAKARVLFSLIAQICRDLQCCALVVTHDVRNAALFKTHYALDEAASNGEHSVFALQSAEGICPA